MMRIENMGRIPGRGGPSFCVSDLRRNKHTRNVTLTSHTPHRKKGIHAKATREQLKGSDKLPFLGCENAAGKVRQKRGKEQQEQNT